MAYALTRACTWAREPEVDDSTPFLSLYVLSVSGQEWCTIIHQWLAGSCTCNLPTERTITQILKPQVLSGRSIGACPWQYIQQLEMENHSHIGDSHGWNSALERRPQVWAPGCGSFSPVATFKLCIKQSLYKLCTSLRNTYILTLRYLVVSRYFV